MIREVCSADIRSVDPMKIRTSQTNTGVQYLKNFDIRIGSVPPSKWMACKSCLHRSVDNGAAMLSSDRRSALTPIHASTTAAKIIKRAPNR